MLVMLRCREVISHIIPLMCLGKANEHENVWETARREAWEEIGLPENIPPPYNVEHLCRLRPHLSRDQLLVTPVVAYLSSTLPETHDPNKLVPSLDTKEVSSLFNLPFEQFLRSSGKEAGIQDWRHASRQIDWLGAKWIFHDFFATVTALVKPEIVGEGDDSSPVPTKIFTRIWGLTARILVDACIVGYGRMPEFEHTVDVWDETKIDAMIKFDKKMASIVGRKVDGINQREFKL
jgi:8-oxo-dGTP pyrophosphatase MutT (NUDIX family)